jgi:hypothetical protein
VPTPVRGPKDGTLVYYAKAIFQTQLSDFELVKIENSFLIGHRNFDCRTQALAYNRILDHYGAKLFQIDSEAANNLGLNQTPHVDRLSTILKCFLVITGKWTDYSDLERKAPLAKQMTLNAGKNNI